MDENIVERAIVPHNPSQAKVIEKEKYDLFAPIVKNGQAGMAQFDQDLFTIVDGKVFINQEVLRKITGAISGIDLINIDDPGGITLRGSKNNGESDTVKFRLECDKFLCASDTVTPNFVTSNAMNVHLIATDKHGDKQVASDTMWLPSLQDFTIEPDENESDRYNVTLKFSYPWEDDYSYYRQSFVLPSPVNSLESDDVDKAPSVKAVKKYVDTPSGEVDAGCTKPVSGGEIYESIEALKDAHDKRITNLENAANDILYTYPTEEATFAHRRMTEDTLAHAALLELGAAPQEHVNLFPEQMLFDFKSENLTITWDDEEKALVINGTLHATESPLVLFSYHLEIPDFRLSFGAFYRGGSVSTQSAKLHIVSNNYSYVDIGLLTKDVTFSKPRSVLGGRFYSIELMADEDTVFENYRFNVLVSREQSFIRYTPFDTRNHFSFPRKLVALGPNVWNGEEKLCGETYVSFTPPSLPGVYTYVLGFSGISSHPETPPLLINFYTEDGFVLEKDLDPGIFHTTKYASEKPITEIRVYAAETEEDSVGYQVQIEKIYVEPVPTKERGTREYSPYHRDEIVFPETLSRFADDFVGDGVTYFNYFDFEGGMYYKECNTFSIDGSLDFQVDETASGTVFAPISLLTETQEKNLAFEASGVFLKAVNTYHSERVWFENGRFYCHSKLFTGKTAEQVKRFFSLCPVDITWEKKSEAFSLTMEEKALLTAPTICLAPNAYLYFADEEGNPVNTRSIMQYQVKQTMEATE